MNTLIFIFSFLLSSFTYSNDINNPHAIYVGVVEIQHEAGSNNTMVIMKVFSDDLLNALRNAFPNNTFQSEPLLCSEYQPFIARYMDDHFVMAVNGRVLKLSLSNCIQQGDSHWLEFNAVCPTQWQAVDVTGDFFMELFPTQSNIITLKHAGRNLFYRLVKNRESFNVEF